MGTAARAGKLNAIRAISESLLEAAREGDWLKAAGLEAERRSLVDSYFSEPVGADEATAVRQVILRLLAIDSEVRDQGREARETLAKQLRGVTQGRAAGLVYGRY